MGLGHLIGGGVHAMAVSRCGGEAPKDLLYKDRFKGRPNLPIGGHDSPLHFLLRVRHPLRWRIPSSLPEELMPTLQTHRLPA